MQTAVRLACVAGLLVVAAASGWAQKQTLPSDDLTPNFKAPAVQSDLKSVVSAV